MNATRILRLAEDRREAYIRSELTQCHRTTLVHYASEYGLPARGMTKEELVDVLTSALLEWAEMEEIGGEPSAGGQNGSNEFLFGVGTNL
jgi:hypothetical protein